MLSSHFPFLKNDTTHTQTITWNMESFLFLTIKQNKKQIENKEIKRPNRCAHFFRVIIQDLECFLKCVYMCTCVYESEDHFQLNRHHNKFRIQTKQQEMPPYILFNIRDDPCFIYFSNNYTRVV